MSFRKSIFMALTALSILSACADKKTKEVKIDAAAVDKVAAEMKEEVAAKEGQIKAAKTKLADSLMRIDSLQQVKEHGHAH